MQYGFFDVCGHHPDANNARFVLAQKMHPAHHRVKRIHDLALRLDAPVLSTTCMGLMRESPAMSSQECAAANASDTAFVPMDATTEQVAFALERHFIVFERLSCKTPEENVKRKTFDVFSINRHAETIVRAFGERHWLVFGAGFEHCLQAVATGLRGLDLPVTILADGCIHGGTSSPVTFAETYERMKGLGVRWAKLDDVSAEAEAA